MKRIILVTVFLTTVLFLNAQIIEPIKWSFDSKQNGKEVDLIFKATIDNGWHLYDTYLPEGGPIATQIVFEGDSMSINFLFRFNFETRIYPHPNKKMINTDSTIIR